MRTSSILLALPALALAADDQKPLGGLFDKIKGAVKAASTYIPSSIPSVIPDPVDAGAAKVADRVVHHLNASNWRSIVVPSEKGTAPEPWMIYLTGANKTCHGMCENADAAWNKAAPVLAAVPKGPQLATVDCENDSVLCNAWIAGPPAIYYFELPRPLADQTKPATTVRYIPLNVTTVTVSDITEIYTKQEYLKTTPYEGVLHPFDGLLAQTGLDIPLGWVLWGLGKMPSWAPMIIISFFSRSFMNRRMPQGGQGGAAPAAR